MTAFKPVSHFDAMALAEPIKDKCMSAFGMPVYSCHKQVNATPLTRGLYNAARGWGVPKDENPNDEGYLVVYNIGTADEYVSWSPKHIFDAGYSEQVTLTHFDRMLIEASDLDAKVASLDKFIKDNPIFGTLDDAEQLRMTRQLSAMAHYASVLDERIRVLKGEDL